MFSKTKCPHCGAEVVPTRWSKCPHCGATLHCKIRKKTNHCKKIIPHLNLTDPPKIPLQKKK